MKKILLVIVFIITIINPSYSSENLTVNGLLEEGYKISKEELVRVGERGTLKIFTLKKGNSSLAICTIEIRTGRVVKVHCVKP